MPDAAIHRLHASESVLVKRSLLGQLRAAHRALAAQIASMEAMTAAAGFEPVRCMAERWKISQASLARRLLAGRICDYLLARRGPPETQSLLALRDSDRELLRRSASHVARWSPQAISVDWRGYCAASRDIRARMQEQMAREQRVLFPLLAGAAEAGKGHGNGASDGARTRDLRRDRPAL